MLSCRAGRAKAVSASLFFFTCMFCCVFIDNLHNSYITFFLSRKQKQRTGNAENKIFVPLGFAIRSVTVTTP